MWSSLSNSGKAEPGADSVWGVEAEREAQPAFEAEPWSEFEFEAVLDSGLGLEPGLEFEAVCGADFEGQWEAELGSGFGFEAESAFECASEHELEGEFQAEPGPESVFEHEFEEGWV